jgi:hypothetical protein
VRASDESATPDLLRPTQREVFLSYARADRKVAGRLDERLRAAGRTTWIDRSGIEPTEEWLAAIHAGIDRSDNFVLLVSPRSVASEWCGREVEAAAARNKRLIPVLVEPTDPASLPPLMGARQWIDCVTDFDAGLARLIKALDRDLDYVHEHTRLLGRAIDWKSGRGGLLTRGELAPAERWLGGAQPDPAPTPLHAELIVASRRAATRTQWQIIAAATVAVVIAIGLAIAAFLQRNEARRQTAAARRNIADTMAAQAVSAAKPRDALRGAAGAADLAVTPATRDALLRVLQRTDQLRFTLDPARPACTFGRWRSIRGAPSWRRCRIRTPFSCGTCAAVPRGACPAGRASFPSRSRWRETSSRTAARYGASAKRGRSSLCRTRWNLSRTRSP